MDHDQVHSVFHKISRFTIILPIIIIALGIVLKPDVPKNAPYRQTITINVTAAPTAIPTSARYQTLNGPGTPINFSGPQSCKFQDGVNYNGNFYIKDKKVFGEVLENKSNRTIYVLLTGDCVYKWAKDVSVGQKMCGLSKYISVLDSMSNLQILTAESLIDNIAEYGNSNISAKDLTTQCNKNAVADSKFQVPTSVKFSLLSQPNLPLKK